jgi:hypothetical protein
MILAYVCSCGEDEFEFPLNSVAVEIAFVAARESGKKKGGRSRPDICTSSLALINEPSDSPLKSYPYSRPARIRRPAPH